MIKFWSISVKLRKDTDGLTSKNLESFDKNQMLIEALGVYEYETSEKSSWSLFRDIFH